jgi:hypothetical protein
MSSYMIVLVIGGGAGLTVGSILTLLHNKPVRQVRRAGREFQRKVRECCPTAKVFSFGGKRSHPDVWIATATDAERDELQQDANLIVQLRAALSDVGYPAEDLPFVQLVLESEETVQRKFHGSWSLRRYAWRRN